MSSFSSWCETLWDHSPRRQNFVMAEVVKTAITVSHCRQELLAGLTHPCSDLHIPSSRTFPLCMTYCLNNQGIISPHHTFVLRVRYNVIPGILMLTLLSLSHPLLFLYYSVMSVPAFLDSWAENVPKANKLIHLYMKKCHYCTHK